MSYWEIREDYDGYDRDGFGMRSEEAERAYREGCRHGYEKGMREAKEMMGQRGGYGERRAMPPYYPESPIGFRDRWDSAGATAKGGQCLLTTLNRR